jgi:hypothetical protein
MGIFRKSTIVLSALCIIGFILIGSVYYLNNKYIGPYLIWKNEKIQDYIPDKIPSYTYDELPIRYNSYVLP